MAIYFTTRKKIDLSFYLNGTYPILRFWLNKCDKKNQKYLTMSNHIFFYSYFISFFTKLKANRDINYGINAKMFIFYGKYV